MNKNSLIYTLLIILVLIGWAFVSNDEYNVQQKVSTVPQNVVIPASPSPPPTLSSTPTPHITTVYVKVTAYAPLDNRSGICADETPRTTATMKLPSRGMVAVNPNRIPYGTKVYVPGYGYAKAEDTGGAVCSYDGIQIEVLMDTYEEAMNWGVRYMEVKILH